MARLAYTFSAVSPLVKKFKAGTGFTAAVSPGIMAIASTTGTAGVLPCTTTGAVDCVGHTLDTTVYTTTQSTTMVEGVVSVVTNPDGVYQYNISGGAASNTAFNTITNSTASTAGTLVTITTGDAAPNSPTMLDGVAYCILGNNVGLSRKVTAVAATTVTALVPFPFTIAVGDKFIVFPFNVGGLSSIGGAAGTLTTTLEQIRHDLASTTTGVALRHLDVNFDYQGTQVLTSLTASSPYTTVFSIPNDSVWALNT